MDWPTALISGPSADLIPVLVTLGLIVAGYWLADRVVDHFREQSYTDASGIVLVRGGSLGKARQKKSSKSRRRKEGRRARAREETSTAATDYRGRLQEALETSQEEKKRRRQLFDARERERRRLARELHDGPIQDLNALGLVLRRRHEDLSEPLGRLQEVTAELRSMCSELRPPALRFGGLSRALEIHALRMQELYPKVDFQVALMDDGRRLTEWSRIQLFRIAQEALANAVRHGRPRQVHLGFEHDAEGFRLWVRDDGRGFQVPEQWVELAQEEHFGLVGMLERADSLGAELQVESIPGRGTELRLDASWPEAVEAESETSGLRSEQGDSVVDHTYSAGGRPSHFCVRDAGGSRRTE